MVSEAKKKKGDAPVRKASLDELILDNENANLGTQRGEFALRESVIRYGVARGIVTDRKGKIIGGNKTTEALRYIGEDVDVVVVPSTGKTLVVTQRVDLDLDDPDNPAARELAFADNRVHELNLAWDPQRIMEGLESDLDLATFFRDHELERIAALEEGEEGEEEVEINDDYDPVPGMELQAFEHWDYIMIVFKNTWDWTAASDALGIEEQAHEFISSKGNHRRKIGLCHVVDGARFLDILLPDRRMGGEA